MYFLAVLALTIQLTVSLQGSCTLTGSKSTPQLSKTIVAQSNALNAILTCSTSHDQCPCNEGFFDSQTSWCAKTPDTTGDYIEIELTREKNIIGFATKGSGNKKQYVQHYILSYSKNGKSGSYKEFCDGNIIKGNSDSNTPNVYMLDKNYQFEAKFIRFTPTDDNNWKSMRIEVYSDDGDEQCSTPHENEAPKESNSFQGQTHLKLTKITCSSENTKYCPCKFGVFNSVGWCPKDNTNKDDNILVTLDKIKKIVGFAVAGLHLSHSYTKSFKLEYKSNENDNFINFKDNCNGLALEGSIINSNDIAFYRLKPGQQFYAKYIKFTPVKYNVNKGLKVEVYANELDTHCNALPSNTKPDGIAQATMEKNSLTYSNNGKIYPQFFNGRFTTDLGWQGTSNINDYLEIELDRVKNIIGWGTAGHLKPGFGGGGWIPHYKISYSLDGQKYTPFCSGGVLDGNTDLHTKVYYNLAKKDQFKAKYIRFTPADYVEQKALKIEVYSSDTEPQCSTTSDTEIPTGLIPQTKLQATTMVCSTESSRNDQKCDSGRYEGHVAWVPSTTTKNDDNIQIVLKEAQTIVAFATLGNNGPGRTNQAWTKSYQLKYSEDGSNWNDYCSGNILDGNKINNIARVYKLPLSKQFKAKYIQFIPHNFNIVKAMRVEVLTENLETCKPTILSNKMIGNPIAQTIYPSTKLTCKTEQTEKKCTQGTLSGIGWCAATRDIADDYIQVDLGKKKNIVGFAILPLHNTREAHTTEFKVAYSDDGNTWKQYCGGMGIPVPGHYFVSLNSADQFEAQYVKIIPTKWAFWKCLKMEVYSDTKDSQYCASTNTELPDINTYKPQSTLSTTKFKCSDSMHTGDCTTVKFPFTDNGYWYSRFPKPDNYFQFELSKEKNINGFAIKSGGHVSTTAGFKLKYSLDGISWKYYCNGDILNGNTYIGAIQSIDNTPLVYTIPKTNQFKAKFIRFEPTAWIIHRGMKMEIYSTDIDSQARSTGYDNYVQIEYNGKHHVVAFSGALTMFVALGITCLVAIMAVIYLLCKRKNNKEYNSVMYSSSSENSDDTAGDEL